MNDNKKQNINLQTGSDITAKKINPLQKKLDNRKKSSLITPDMVKKLCKDKLSIDSMAATLKVSPLVIAVHVGRLLKKGENIDINLFVSPQKRTDIKEAFYKLNTTSIKRVVNELQGSVTEENVRIVRGYLQGRMQEDFL